MASGIDQYSENDIVIIASCSHKESLKNNGAFRIFSISENDITLVNKDTYAAIVTGTDKTGCTIETSNFVVTSNQYIWSEINFIDSASFKAISPVGVGKDIPVKITINGVSSKYATTTGKFSYTTPNITSVPHIPPLAGSQSGRLYIEADEVGTFGNLNDLSIIIAAEGASACGGTDCTDLNMYSSTTAIADDAITINSITSAGVYTLGVVHRLQ